MAGSHKLFVDGTLLDWQNAFLSYPKVFEKKASLKSKKGASKELKELDKWYQEELSGIMQSRKEKHITHAELSKLMKWKLARGKFRPRLIELVQVNKPDEVISASKKAFSKLPDVAQAIKALVVLKAVGPATASAVLAAGAPGHAAFMADEAMLAIPGLLPLQYTLNHYLAFNDEIQGCVKRLNKQDPNCDWTAHKVELALWTYQVAQQVDPSLLAGNGEGGSEKRKANGKDVDSETGSRKKTKR